MKVPPLFRFALPLWVLINLACAVWTNDLTQVNRETLFLTRSGNQTYDQFKSVVDERRVLAVKLETEPGKTMTEATYQEVRAIYEGLKAKYTGDQFAWMDFQDIYSRAIGDLNYTNIAAFAHKFPRLIMPLLGDVHTGFLLMIDQKVDDRMVTNLMHDIMKANWPKELKVFPGGLPYVNVKLNEYADDIKFTLIPLMVAVSVLITWWLTRSLKVAGLLIIPAVFSLLQSLALAKGLYGSLNMVTAVVPLMMFVINLMVCFHLFYAMRGAGSFKAAWAIKRVPLVLSVVTMAVGFAANLVSEVPVIRQFAVVSTVAVLVTSVMSGIGVYLMEPWFVAKAGDQGPRMFNPNSFARALPLKIIAGLSIAAVVAASVAAPKLELLTDATRYFPESSGLREAIQRVEKDFLGTPAFELLVRRTDDAPMTFDDQKNMRALEIALKSAMERPYKIFSLGALLTEANLLFSGEEAFPPQRITWTMLMGGLPETVRGSFPAGPAYRISLMGTMMNSDAFRGEVKHIESVIPKFAEKGYKVELNGLNYQLMRAQEKLISVMAEGFAVTLLVVTTLFAATFRSLKIVGGFLVASLLPIMVGVIAIYLLGFSLNIATVMTFSIALGMIVDNSFHMTWNITRGRPYKDYYADTIVPIVGSGVILGIGFAMFSVNGFLPIRQVGVLVAVMLVSGIAASLFVLNPGRTSGPG